MTNLDFGDDLKWIDPRERSDDAEGTWPAKRRLASALRELIGEMCPTGASREEILQAAEWTEDCVERFAAAPRVADDPRHSGGAKGGAAPPFRP